MSKRKNRIPILMSDEELQAVDDWRRTNRVANRSDAVCQLTKIALLNGGLARKSIEELAASVSGDGIPTVPSRPPSDPSGLKALFDAVEPIGDIDDFGPAS
jgi:hypothetical protein